MLASTGQLSKGQIGGTISWTKASTEELIVQYLAYLAIDAMGYGRSLVGVATPAINASYSVELAADTVIAFYSHVGIH